MQHSVDCLVRVLESYRGRDKVIRTLCYGSQLLSQCRMVLRLFDDLSMLAYSTSYGFGAKEKDGMVRWISVLTNVADQLYYPCEHVAWAADAQLVRVKSDRWWLISTVLWGTSLLLGILRSLRVLKLLKKELRKRDKDGIKCHCQIHGQMQAELLSILGCMTDLSNAIHWMPQGFLWAGRFPPWLVGLMGTISSLVGLIKMKETVISDGCCSK
ncbi:peroxisomal membrane protein 11C isoform X2 [Festucalex cinctus]